MHTTQSESTSLLSSVKGVLPIVLLIVTATSQYFTLQGQIIELRAKYEASSATTKESIEGLKSDVRETNSLLRDSIREAKNTK